MMIDCDAVVIRKAGGTLLIRPVVMAEGIAVPAIHAPVIAMAPAAGSLVHFFGVQLLGFGAGFFRFGQGKLKAQRFCGLYIGFDVVQGAFFLRDALKLRREPRPQFLVLPQRLFKFSYILLYTVLSFRFLSGFPGWIRKQFPKALGGLRRAAGHLNGFAAVQGP